jgi:hypothetical protein
LHFINIQLTVPFLLSPFSLDFGPGSAQCQPSHILHDYCCRWSYSRRSRRSRGRNAIAGWRCCGGPGMAAGGARLAQRGPVHVPPARAGPLLLARERRRPLHGVRKDGGAAVVITIEEGCSNACTGACSIAGGSNARGRRTAAAAAARYYYSCGGQ